MVYNRMKRTIIPTTMRAIFPVENFFFSMLNLIWDYLKNYLPAPPPPEPPPPNPPPPIPPPNPPPKPPDLGKKIGAPAHPTPLPLIFLTPFFLDMASVMAYIIKIMSMDNTM